MRRLSGRQRLGTSSVLIAGLAFAATLVGCGGSSSTEATDTPTAGVFARFADVDDGSETVMISPADPAVGAFDVMPVPHDTAIVRAVAGDDGDARSVEVLVKGSFPDGCTELHELEQAPTSDGELAGLTMRRPQGAICTQVVRPYRFFFELDRQYQPGRFSLDLNGRSYAFVVE